MLPSSAFIIIVLIWNCSDSSASLDQTARYRFDQDSNKVWKGEEANISQVPIVLTKHLRLVQLLWQMHTPELPTPPPQLTASPVFFLLKLPIIAITIFDFGLCYSPSINTLPSSTLLASLPMRQYFFQQQWIHYALSSPSLGTTSIRK